MPCVDPLHILVFSSLSVRLQVLAQVCILKTGGIEGTFKATTAIGRYKINVKLEDYQPAVLILWVLLRLHRSSVE